MMTKKKFTLKQQGQFLIRASDMLNNGFTLLEVLHFLSRLYDHKHVIINMIEDLQNGEPIYKALLAANFEQQVCAQIYFAEKHGFLSDALQESGNYLLKKDEQRKKLIKLMQYPLILLFVLLLVAVILNTMLLPRFQLLYTSMGYEPHVSIQLFLHLIDTLPFFLLVFFIIIMLVVIITKWFTRTRSALEMATVYSTLPFIKSHYKLYKTIFLAREWSYLLKSGFSMNEIITIMETQTFNPLLRETAEKLKKMLVIGYSFSNALSYLKFIEDELIVIVTHGEKNSRLDHELYYYSNICLQKFEEKILRIFIVIQPIFFLFVGLMVMTIYMAIFFPMFQMMESI